MKSWDTAVFRLQNIGREVLVIGGRLLKSREWERVLEEVYARNRLQQVLEELVQARRLTERLTTEYLDAMAAIPHLNPHSLPLQFGALPNR